MKVPVLSIFIVLIFALLTCALFINDNPEDRSPVMGADLLDTGRVLGVSEALAEPGTGRLYLNLYDQAGITALSEQPAEPQKIGTEKDFELPTGRGVVLDVVSGAVLYSQAAEEMAPIASITKLATTLVFLEHNPGWDKIYEVKASDRIEGGRIYLSTGDRVKVKDLFYLCLVASDNTAAQALVRSTGLKEEEFIALMNAKMKILGLINTSFADPIGLSNGNVSTAVEVARLARAALDVKDISRATLTDRYDFQTAAGRKIAVYNTDILLGLFPQNGIDILGGKTGYIDSAGYCFVGKFADSLGRQLISVVLGSDKPNLRFRWAKNLAEWTYRNYQWPD